MAKVQFNPKKNTKSRRHITLADCGDGDIVYLEERQIFCIIIESDYDEKKVVDLADGECEWFSADTLCKVFSGEINFDVEDFEEFT